MAYNGPTRVNMSDYIATLNTVPDNEMQPNPDFLEDDLAMFTNANFFDFDLGQDADLQPTEYMEGRREQQQQQVAPDAVDMKSSLDFIDGKPYSLVLLCSALLHLLHPSSSAPSSIASWLLSSSSAPMSRATRPRSRTMRTTAQLGKKCT